MPNSGVVCVRVSCLVMEYASDVGLGVVVKALSLVLTVVGWACIVIGVLVCAGDDVSPF